MPTQRECFPFSFLKHNDLGKNAPSPEGMYDYFTTEIHQEHAKQEAVEFYSRYLEGKALDFQEKRILDISGGNGFFVRWFQENLGAKASLSEFNKKAVAFAKEMHPFETVLEYDMNNDKLVEKASLKLDIVIAKACLMFCEDVKGFAEQIREILAPGGVLILAHSVEPTLGTLVRVQLDEFSYFALRQPGSVQKAFESAGFSVMSRVDETDPDLYVYDHDLLPHWMVLHYLYEIKGALRLRKERLFKLPARDRRRSTFIFSLDD